MDIQFYGANCISLTYKSVRIVVDDNLSQLGKKSVTKPGDVALFTSQSSSSAPKDVRITLDSPGEYEVADISVVGIPARAHTDEATGNAATMFKVTAGEVSVLVTGHVYPQLSDTQIESIGLIDVLVVPVGGHGYTLDPQGALTIIKEIEPKIVIPTHYESDAIDYPIPQLSLSEAIKELAMEPKETVSKLRLRSGEMGDVTQLVILETV